MIGLIIIIILVWLIGLIGLMRLMIGCMVYGGIRENPNGIK